MRQLKTARKKTEQQSREDGEVEREYTKSELVIGNVDRRAFRDLTIVPLQSLQSESQEPRRVLERRD